MNDDDDDDLVFFGLFGTLVANLQYTVSQKNDRDVAHYNFNAHQPILVIFGRDVAEGVCYVS